MLEASMAMIHGPHTFAMGGASDFRQVAELLDKEASVAASIYKRRMSAEDVDRMLESGDHYFTAAEAVDAGLADGIYDNGNDDSDDDGKGDDKAQINTDTKMDAEAREHKAKQDALRLGFLATGMLN